MQAIELPLFINRFDMIVQATNTTSNTLTYSAENFSIAANTTATLSNTLLPSFASDPNFLSDVRAGNITLGDSVINYLGYGAIQFLNNQIQLLSSNTNSSNNYTETTTGNSGPISTGGLGCLSLSIAVTTASGTNPTIQLDIQSSNDGINFTQVHSTKQMTGVDFHTLYGVRISSQYYRYTWTIGGTDPSFTFTVNTTLKNFLPVRSSSQFRYADVDLSGIGNTSSDFDSDTNQNVGLHIIRPDDGYSQAEVAIEVSHDSVNWDQQSGNIPIVSNSSETVDFSGNAYRYFRLVVVTAASGPAPTDILWASNGGT